MPTFCENTVMPTTAAMASSVIQQAVHAMRGSPTFSTLLRVPSAARARRYHDEHVQRRCPPPAHHAFERGE
jgi:hypothetical protein